MQQEMTAINYVQVFFGLTMMLILAAITASIIFYWIRSLIRRRRVNKLLRTFRIIPANHVINYLNDLGIVEEWGFGGYTIRLKIGNPQLIAIGVETWLHSLGEQSDVAYSSIISAMNWQLSRRQARRFLAAMTRHAGVAKRICQMRADQRKNAIHRRAQEEHQRMVKAAIKATGRKFQKEVKPEPWI